MNVSECEGCGAENELLVSSCVYCGNSLVDDKNIEKESDELEELVQQCSSWIGKYEGIVSNIGALNNAKQMDSVSATPMFGSLISKSFGSKAISYSEILRKVHHYLDILEIKSSNSSILREKVAQFKKRYERAQLKERETNKKKVRLIVGLVLAFVLLITFCLIMASLE
tara:strand:+ start:182 stop:688 length:507 start_codon:yes stop_codon:yes gene_type:complete